MNEKVILLVEDNPDDEMLILRALEKDCLASRIVVALDDVEALDYLFRTDPHEDRDMGGQPMVIFLDVKLPRLDGLEVLRRVRDDARTRLLPVVMLTSSDEERDISESYRLGANSYVLKSVDFTQFAETVRQMGLYWLVFNRPPVRM